MARAIIRGKMESEYALDTPAGPGREKYRLITSLLDERAFPAEQLAATYHERWEIETALDEVKVHQWAHPRPLRSKHPREVVQEVYGLLLADGVIVRPIAGYGMPEHLRITVGLPEQNERFLAALARALGKR